MKTKIITALSCCLPMILIAQYTGHHVSFNVVMKKMKNDNSISGYNFVVDEYTGDKDFDYKSFYQQNPEILFDNYKKVKNKKYIYYQNKLLYKPYPNKPEFFMYIPINPEEINIKKIQSIEVTDLYETEAFVYIYGKYSVQDQEWMNIPPVAEYNIAGIQNTYTILVHESSEEIDLIIQQLKELQEKFLNELQGIHHGMDETKAYEKIDNINKSIGNDIPLLLEQLDGKKVVVITMTDPGAF